MDFLRKTFEKVFYVCPGWKHNLGLRKQLPKIFSPNQPTGKVILWQFNNIYQLPT